MIGFVGLGLMGSPMALNLARAGTELIVWNRTPARCLPIQTAGAHVAGSLAEVFDRAETVLLMLADAAAVDTVLRRGTPEFAARVDGHTLVPMGTVAPEYSAELAVDVAAAGGRYVEAPVSGSSVQAAAGTLVGLLAGEPGVLDRVAPLLAPVCRDTVRCGAAPNALLAKLAVNLYLITSMTALAESVHFAERAGLDPATLVAALEAGPVTSAVPHAKGTELATRAFVRYTPASDALAGTHLIADTAHTLGAATPLLEVCRALLTQTVASGHADDDMAAVITALEQRARPATDA